ncbi:MAG: TylF/MycF/NovP-related O-methyltransferase [Pseudomonadota bacterium]
MPWHRLHERIAVLERSQPPLIDRAAWFVACEMIEGDYLEFGTFKGHAFAAAYHAFQRAFERRIALLPEEATDEQRARRRTIWESMNFVALDSFEGLPTLEGVDRVSEDFRQGQYGVSQASFERAVAGMGVPPQRTVVIPGWYAETSNAATWESHSITKAAVIWIDCDLYASTRDALAGLGPLLQDGTVLIFDDWFAFKANPNRGEQRAFAEWREGVAGFDFVHFHSEGTWRNSFVAVARDVEGEPP